MKDSESKRRPGKPGEDGPDDSLDALLSSYTPKQRERVLKGLQVLARVAVRSFIEEEASRSRYENEGEEGER